MVILLEWKLKYSLYETEFSKDKTMRYNKCIWILISLWWVHVQNVALGLIDFISPSEQAGDSSQSYMAMHVCWSRYTPFLTIKQIG